jgi:pyruvate dehydrogenase E2 component (dihydrolipoamide acetyltransferase)
MKHIIILPDLGQTTSEAKVVKWLKVLGDKLSAGEPLLEVETDKATMEVEAYVGGYLRRKLAQEGDLASTMSPIAILTDTSDERFEEEGSATKPDAAGTQASSDPSAAGVPQSKPVAAVPAARARARELGIELSSVPGTGPNGLITKTDVERFAAGGRVEAPQMSGPLGDLKSLAAMAALTSASKSTIPHFYVTVDFDVTRAEAWRSSWNASHPGCRVSINDYLVRAASKALFDSPRFNVRLAEGRYVQQATAELLLVVGGEPGLVLVPLPDLHAAPLEEFVPAIRTAVNSARQNRMTTSAFKVSPLLALSNLGMFDVKQFAAIIPTGCTAILAVGSVREQLILRAGTPQSVKVCTVTLSADHRVVDGVAAAKLLASMQSHLNSL